MEALHWMDVLLLENTAYTSLTIEKIDGFQRLDLVGKYEYHYVPAFYVGEEKVHEGVASFDKIRRVFDAAMGA